MATSIADLFVSVTSDVSGALSGLTSVDEKVNGTSASMAAAAPAGYALAGAATAIGGAFLSSIAVASDFEHQMSGVKAVLSPDEVAQFGDALSGLALQLGKDTVFSAREAAAGIEELIKAGVSATDVMGGAAAAALSLAAATGIPVDQAATLAAQAMNIFGKTADDLGKKGGVVDFLAGTANASAASMSDLSFGLQAAGAVAQTVGLSFEDTTTAIGLFANNGLRGSDAGTSLKTMLINLIPQTKSARTEFASLGLITEDGSNAFFDATGKAKGLGEISGILQNALKGMGDEQQVAALKILFGTDAMRAASILAREGSEGFDTLKTSIEGISAADGAKIRMDNLSGSLQQMGGSFETIQITIGNLFLPVLRSLVDGVTVLLNAFLTLDPSVQVTIVSIVGIAGAAAGLLAGFILLGPVLGAVGAAFGIIAGAAATVALPILGLVAVGAALYEAWQTNFGGIRDVTDQVVLAIQPALKNIQDFATAFLAELGPAFEGVRTAVAPFITALSNDLAPVLARLPDLIRLIGDGFNLLRDPAQAIVSIIQILATGNYNGGIFGLDQNSGVVQFFTSLHDAIALFFDAVLKLLNGDFSGAWDSLWGSFTTVLQTAFTAEGQLFSAIGEAIVTFLQAIPGWIAQNVPGMWDGFINSAWDIGTHLGDAFRNFLGFIGTSLNGIPETITHLGDLWEPFVSAAWDIGRRLGEAFTNFLTFIGQALGGIPTLISNLGDFWEPFITSAWNIGTHLGEAFGNFLGFIGNALGGIPNLITGLGDLWAPFVTSAWDIGTHLGDAFGNFLGFIGQALGGIPDMISGLGDLWAPFITSAWNIGSDLGDAFGNFLGFIGEALGGIPTFIANLDIFGGIIDQAKAIFQGISDAIEPIRQLIASTFGNVWNWVTSGGTTNTGGGSGAPAPAPTPIGGGSSAGGGPLISIGTVNIGSQADMDAFLQQMSDAILASARRVQVPAGL